MFDFFTRKKENNTETSDKKLSVPEAPKTAMSSSDIDDLLAKSEEADREEEEEEANRIREREREEERQRMRARRESEYCGC